MANLIEEPKWEEGVYQFTRGDFLEGGEDGIDNVPTRQLANRTQFLKEYIDSFIDKIPQALLPPVKLDLESELPDISELTSKDIGLFYIIQNMDISAEGKTGKAWLNYEDGDNANDLIWYKSFDQYYSADGVSIILTPTGKLQVGLDWFNSILESSDIVADIEEIKTALTLSANDPLLSYTPTGSLQSQIGFNVVDEKLEVTGRNGMLIASIDIPKGAGGGIEDAPYEEIITPGSPETSATIGDWTPGTVPATSLTSVCYGNGLFVAVGGGNNRIITSPDGITWTARTAAEANQWRSVCYGNGLFVAVSGDGANQVMTSSDGITWTARTVPFDSWSSVTYGNGLFVAVSSIGISVVMTSPDGITWTARTALPNSWRSVTYGNGLFVVVSTSMFMTSIDGIAWTAHWAPLREFWISIAYGNGLFVAVAQTGTHRVVTSPDGITWTARTVPFDSWSSVTYGNGLFVAVSGDGANQVMTSSDGITWTARTALPNSWRSVTYGNGLFVAVSGDGANQVMTSPLIPATPEVPAVVERRYPLHLRRYKEWVEFDSVQAFDSARLGGKLADEFGTREWVREEIEKGGGGSGNVDSVDGVYPDTSVDPDNKNVELFKHITKEELEAMQADPSLAQDGVKYICVDESSRGVVTTMMPDYANRVLLFNLEGVNSNVWVADRIGYIVYGGASSANDSLRRIHCIVNNQIVDTVNTHHHGAAFGVSLSGVIPVNIGDHVVIASAFSQALSNLQLFFIPPKLSIIKDMAVVVEVGTDTSLLEKPVMLYDPVTKTMRQKRDLDGSLIWERTFEGVITAAVSADIQNVLMGNARNILDVKGWWHSGSTKMYSTSTNSGANLQGFYNVNGNNLIMHTRSGTERTNAPYQITARYTKAGT